MPDVIEATLRRQRIVAVSTVALGVLCGSLGLVRFQGAPGALLALGPKLLAAAYLTYRLLRRPSRAQLRLATSAFYAPPRGPVALPVAVTTWLLYLVIYDDGEQQRDAPWALLFAALAVGMAGFVLSRQWRNVALIDLTPEGIGMGWPRRSAFVPWSALDLHHPIYALDHDRALRLPLARPDLVHRRFGRRRDEHSPGLGDIDVAPSFLAAAVRHYARYPEYRAAIGTPEEYNRLRSALAAPQPGVPHGPTTGGWPG
ncbi:hypothetical protein ACNAW0_18645 [Micromonospora sp. SL1-18]|uniref:hypothetical protein n=1 Tax=Micromonospora sp. SL1-18 TaxID=3399128 RepID=UPI003A4D99C0